MAITAPLAELRGRIKHSTGGEAQSYEGDEALCSVLIFCTRCQHRALRKDSKGGWAELGWVGYRPDRISELFSAWSLQVLRHKSLVNTFWSFETLEGFQA